MNTSVQRSKYPDTSLHEELPRNVFPLNYNISCFNLDYKNNKFDGTTVINFKVISKSNVITLNQKLLNFKSVLLKKGELVQKASEITKNDEKETVEIKFEESIDPDFDEQVQLTVDYSGIIRTDMAGLYISNYKDEQGEIKYILTTQFESTDARSAFPCYDEPNAKAEFSVNLEVPDSLQALSNMPCASEIHNVEAKTKTFKFETSPKMSTYLVAWAIGEFEYVETKTVREYNGAKLPIRVYTVPGQSHTGKYALETAVSAVDYLSTVFDIDYPLPKLDLLAVPQFGANAMENWGLVTFRSTALLYDPENSSVLYKQKVSYVVSHEIAHSWFGNYCTMNWWSDLWLNESFATYVGWLCVDDMHPEWDVFTDFVSGSMQTALDLDSLKNSHPIEVQVYHANEIDEIFDAISYLKGASVVRMVAESIGVELFLKGVSNYLKKYPFANAKSDDLWDAISEVSGKNITKLVEPWIRAIGYPYLKVNKLSNGHIIVKQQRFLTEGITAEDDLTTWWVPNVEDMTEKEKVLLIKDNEFLKLNKDNTGFYRVFYDESLFSNIVRNLDQLSAKDKIGLIADTSAGCRAGIMKTSQFLELVSEMKDENNIAVWSQIISRLNSLKNVLFSNVGLADQLTAFARDLYKCKFEELMNKEKLDFNEERLFVLLFEQAGLTKLEQAVSLATEMFKTKDIKPQLKQAVYKTLFVNNTPYQDEIFKTLLKEVKDPSTIESREIALRTLGSVSNVDTYLSDILDLFFDGSVPEMDFQFLALPLASNKASKVSFWEFFKANYPKFRNDVSMWTLDRVIKGFVPKLVSDELYKDIDLFFSTKNNNGYEKGLKQGLDSVRDDVNWSHRAVTEVSSWFNK